MSVPIEYLLVLAAFALIVWWGWSRRQAAAPAAGMYLLLHDGSGFVLYEASRDKAGNLVLPGGQTFAAGVCRRVELEVEHSPMYVMAAEPLALASHRQLEESRRNIVMGNIFKSGGDLAEMLRLVGACLVIVGALFMVLQLRSFSASLAGFDASLRTIDDRLSKPLVVAPGDTQPRPVEK